MSSIALYQVNGSCAMAAHILLRELQIPFKRIRLQSGPNGYEAADSSFTHEDYVRDIHHMGYVPALVVDGTVITENPAILTCIADMRPNRHLLGETSIQRAKVTEWLVWLSSTLHGSGYGALWRPVRFVDDAPESYSKIQEKGRAVIRKCYDRIEKSCQAEYAIGDNLTVVDIFLHVFYRWGNDIGIHMGAKYPRYRGLAGRVESLQSVKEVMSEEGCELQVR